MTLEETIKLANQGDAQSQYNLGSKYYFGISFAKDHKKAFYWYKKAAEQDHYLAKLQVSSMYELGEGVKKDMMKSFAWLGRATV